MCWSLTSDLLTEELKIDPEEINTFVEDIWAGGGNMGPSVEYFIHGLELHMVFMQYKYDNEVESTSNSVKVIDVGIDWKEFHWLINGSAIVILKVFITPSHSKMKLWVFKWTRGLKTLGQNKHQD